MPPGRHSWNCARFGAVNHRRIGIASVVVALALTSVAAPALAVDARELKAREEFAAGRYQEALDIFAKLYAETLHPIYLRNVGRCYQNLGDPDKAIISFRDYLRKRKTIEPDERREIEGFIAEMEELKKQREAAATAPRRRRATEARVRDHLAVRGTASRDRGGARGARDRSRRAGERAVIAVLHALVVLDDRRRRGGRRGAGCGGRDRRVDDDDGPDLSQRIQLRATTMRRAVLVGVAVLSLGFACREKGRSLVLVELTADPDLGAASVAVIVTQAGQPIGRAGGRAGPMPWKLGAFLDKRVTRIGRRRRLRFRLRRGGDRRQLPAAIMVHPGESAGPVPIMLVSGATSSFCLPATQARAGATGGRAAVPARAARPGAAAVRERAAHLGPAATEPTAARGSAGGSGGLGGDRRRRRAGRRGRRRREL